MVNRILVNTVWGRLVRSPSRTYLLFLCLGFFVPLENFSLIWRRHHDLWRAANFNLCSALMAIVLWGFFSVSHLLWHGASRASVYNGHLWGPVTLAPISERLAVELSLSVFTTKVCHGWDSNTQHSACEANALTHCAPNAARTDLGSTSNIWLCIYVYISPMQRKKLLQIR